MKKKQLSLVMAMVMAALAGCGGSSGTGNAGSVSNNSGASPAALAGPAAGNSMGNSAGNAADDAALASSQFLMEAYRDGLAEIQLSQRALQQSANADVRNFAQRMVDEHTRLNGQIAQLAQRKNIALPTELTAEQQALAARLSALSGDEFDRAYMAANVAAHETDVTAARLQATGGDDPDVSTLADAGLPILKIHLAVAEEINSLLDPAAFLAGAYRDGLAEIQVSQLAVQKASNDEVRRFAQRMIDDHTQANNQIAALAQQKGITLPDAPSPQQQAVADELSRLSGADFDKAYMDENVVMHVKDVRQAQQQAERGRDAQIAGFARQVSPTLVSHLAAAIDIDGRIQADALFRAYQNSRAQIQFAHLTLLQGANEQVKAVAQQTLTEQSAALAKIKQQAQQQSVTLYSGIAPEQLRLFIDLLGKSGSDFDRQYTDISTQLQAEAAALASGQSQGAADNGLGRFWQDLLSTLNDELARATRS